MVGRMVFRSVETMVAALEGRRVVKMVELRAATMVAEKAAVMAGRWVRWKVA